MNRMMLVSMLAVVACTKDGDDTVDSDTDVVVEQVDADGDGYYESADCDDSDPKINPSADERCDEIDNDCDTLIDDDDEEVRGAPRWHRDNDRDGYGAQFDIKEACKQPSKYVEDGSDCDDDNEEVNPGMTEVCGNELDDDCEGTVDEGKWYYDLDDDGYGDETAAPSLECEQPANTTTVRKDCDDTRADVNPDMHEICGDELDQDCDGEVNLCEFEPDEADIQFTLSSNPTGSAAAADYFGADVVVADVNGDGIGDAAIGASGYDTVTTGTYASPGMVYVFGGAPTAKVLKSTVDTFAVITDTEASGFGTSIAGNEIDGDDYADLVVGGPNASSGAGRTWLFSGAKTTGALAASDAQAIIETTSLDALGYAVDSWTDLDQDGQVDFLATAYTHPVGSGYGRVYAIDGSVLGTMDAADAALFAVDAPASYTTPYSGYPLIGWNAVDAGDTDGDGVSEVIIGAPIEGASGEGKAYLFDGTTTGVVDTTAATASYAGSSASGVGDLFGWQVARLGDLDGDGRQDFAISGVYYSAVTTQGGATWVIHGGDPGAYNAVDVAQVTLTGDAAGQQNGQISHAGDIDGDGTTDLCMGAPSSTADTGEWTGSAYCFYDIASKTGSIAVTDADLKFYDTRSPGGGFMGLVISMDGDFTGDGKDDLILPAPAASVTTPDGTNTGAAYLFTTF